jgi:hypothetical protein
MPTNDVPYKLKTVENTNTMEYTSTVTTQDNREEWGIVKKMRFYRKAVKWLWKHRAEDNNRHKWRRMMREVQE